MTPDEDMKARAWDFVLGLLAEEDQRQAERDMEHDAAFANAVSAASAQLHKLDLTAAHETVPAHLWDRISQQIADMPQKPLERGGIARVVPNGTVRRVGPASLGGWRGLAVAASLAAACGIGYFGALATTTAPQPVVVVVLNTSDNVPGAVFEAFADDSVRIVPLEDFTVPEGQIMQVWTLYDPAVGPVSLGTIGRTAAEVRLQGPHLPLPKPDQLYEITLEPAPRSPTGKPTGPILVKGFARQPAGT
jgi:anti-sigma-K factor RskA